MIFEYFGPLGGRFEAEGTWAFHGLSCRFAGDLGISGLRVWGKD